MTTITLNHVSKRFEQQIEDSTSTVAAIEDVSLKIASGEVVAILGPSGCGKSTLLRLIAGLIPPDSGEVLYDNQSRSTTFRCKIAGLAWSFRKGA